MSKVYLIFDTVFLHVLNTPANLLLILNINIFVNFEVKFY